MELGKIIDVPLRELWPGEATDFTPWLSKNLHILSETIGIDLELESTEVSAGDFSADIIAREISTNKIVVIENQFGNTDHRHLGQIITYASVLGAEIVVWIAENIRAEHKAAIEFLNRNLKESLQLFALEAKTIKIDASKPAFILDSICFPLEMPRASKANQNETNETKEKYRTFFQGLIDALREKYRFTNARAGQPQNWYTFASENSKIYKYSACFSLNSRIRVEIYIDCGSKEKNEAILDGLYASKDDIENELGYELSWEQLPTKRACRIALYRDGDIDAESETLNDIQNWAIANLLKFKSIFPRRIESTLGSLRESNEF